MVFKIWKQKMKFIGKKAQFHPKMISLIIGFIVGWVVAGQINQNYSIIGGAVGAFIAFRMF